MTGLGGYREAVNAFSRHIDADIMMSSSSTSEGGQKIMSASWRAKTPHKPKVDEDRGANNDIL